MEEIRDLLKTRLDPKDDVMESVVNRLQSLGVEHVEHLKWVKETDFTGILTIIEARMFLSPIHDRGENSERRPSSKAGEIWERRPSSKADINGQKNLEALIVLMTEWIYKAKETAKFCAKLRVAGDGVSLLGCGFQIFGAVTENGFTESSRLIGSVLSTTGSAVSACTDVYESYKEDTMIQDIKRNAEELQLKCEAIIRLRGGPKVYQLNSRVLQESLQASSGFTVDSLLRRATVVNKQATRGEVEEACVAICGCINQAVFHWNNIVDNLKTAEDSATTLMVERLEDIKTMLESQLDKVKGTNKTDTCSW